MNEHNEIANNQADDRGLLVDESEMSDKIGRQGSNCRSGNIGAPAIYYNKNKLVPTKYR